MLRLSLIVLCLVLGPESYPDENAAPDAGLLTADDPVRALEILANLKPLRDEPISFVERRANPLFGHPLELRGTVMLNSDGTMTKSILVPFEERVEISENTAVWNRDGKSRRLNLSDRSTLGLYLKSLKALINGDGGALADRFELSSEIADASWTVTLVPKDARLRSRLSAVIVTGCGEDMRALRSEEGEGVWQEMLFQLPSEPP